MKNWRRWLRVATTLALLGFTLWWIDVDGLARTLLAARTSPLLAALALTIPVLALLAWRWAFTVRRMGLQLGFAVALREYYVSTLLNQVLPGGVIGDVTRVFRLSTQTPGERGRIARGVVIDRVSGQVALWLTVIIGATVWGARTEQTLAVVLVASVVTVLLAAGLALRIPRIAASRAGTWIRELLAELRASFVERGAWAWQLLASLATVALLSAMFVLCMVSVGSVPNASQTLLVAPLVLAVASLPISVGGWGPREVAAAGLFEFVGFGALEGAAASAAFGVVNLLGSLPGVLFVGRSAAGDKT